MTKYDDQTGMFITKEDYINENIAQLPNSDLLEQQWNNLPSTYDSKADTLLHIKRVNELMGLAAIELIKRGNIHDNSKLTSPEKEYFDRLTPRLKSLVYGSQEYSDSLKELSVALDNHYKENTHHPEHYENGINGFDLFDLIEMFMDWTAAGERVKGGNIENSIEVGKKRFNISDQLCDIFRNTAKRYKF